MAVALRPLDMKVSQALAQHEPAPITEKDVQPVEVAVSGAILHETFWGLTVVKGKSVSNLVEGDLGQTFIIGALRSHDPVFPLL